MKFKFYVGIDVSKLSLDVFIHELQAHRKFKNNPDGYAAIIQWIETNTKHSCNTVLICFEHTGIYSMPLSVFLEQRHIAFAMVPPLEIKRSMGITRGKNDIVDARRIAEYAFRFQDKIILTKLPAREITKLHFLLTLRDKTARNLSGYIAARNEIYRAVEVRDLPELFSSYDVLIATLRTEIKRLEAAIKQIISSNSELNTSFKLVTSLKGVSLIVGAYLIVYTCNFTKLEDWRKFACYCGIAPFEYQSGTSVHGRTRVNPIANKQMKRLLHLSAVNASYTDPELHEYYRRRQAEGKPNMTILNIIRNKIVARAFAVLKWGTPYVNIKNYIA